MKTTVRNQSGGSRALKLLLLTTTLLATTASQVLADLVTFRVTARVRSVNGMPGVQMGNTILSAYTFDSNAVDFNPAQATHGRYQEAVTAVAVNIGGNIFGLSADPAMEQRIAILNNAPSGTGLIESYAHYLDLDNNGGWLWLNLVSSDLSVYANDSLPTNPPDLARFDISRTLVLERWSGGTRLVGTLDARMVADVLAIERVDISAPVLSLPGDLVVEATGPAGAAANYAASATDDVDGAVPVTLSPASGSTFPLGTTTVNASATDAAGNTASGSFTVTVQDTTAPVITSLSVSSAVLWPPSHKMVSVSVSGEATEAVSEVTGRILSVTSNEPDNGLGDGDTAGDIVITNPGTVSLRAERSAKGNGRIYTILFEAKDAAGNASTKTVTVSVPKSQGK